LLVAFALVGALWAQGAAEHHQSSDSGKPHPMVAAAADRHDADGEPGRLAHCDLGECGDFKSAPAELPLTRIASGAAPAARNDEPVEALWVSLDPPIPRSI